MSAPETSGNTIDVMAESRQFMQTDLRRSGLVPEDFPIPPQPLTPIGEGIARYRLHYTDTYHKDRINRQDDKYIGPKDVSPQIVFLGEFDKAPVIATVEALKKSVLFNLTTGIPTIAIDSCWGFGERVESGVGEVKELATDLIRKLSPGQTHICLFDGDWQTNDNVGKAVSAYNILLEEQGVRATFIDLGLDKNGNHRGYDDWFVATFGIDRSKWPTPDKVVGELLKLPRIPAMELDAARSYALGSKERFSKSYLDLTDRGTGSLLIKLIGEANLRYLIDSNTWVIWQSGRWFDLGPKPLELVDTATRHYLIRAAALQAQVNKMAGKDEYANRKVGLEKQSKAYRTWAEKHCSSTAGRGSILEDMKNRLTLQANLSDFDSNPDLLGVQNGVVDLRTGALRPEEQADMILKRCPVDYADQSSGAIGPSAQRIKTFLEEITGSDHGKPDAKRLKWLQRRLGAGLRGRNSLSALEIWHGIGANGKSVLSLIIQGMLGLTKDGGYAAAISAGVVLSAYHSRDPEASTPSRMGLVGARLAFMAETKDTAHFDEAYLKQLTGGDLFQARGNYQNAGTYENTASLVLLTNNKPNITEGGKALWDRIAPFEFAVRWRRPNRVIVDADEQGLPLGDTWFETEAPKDKDCLEWLLWWLVMGGVEWEQVGLGEPPQDVTADLQAYMDDQDKYAEWMADQGLVFDPESTTTSGVIYTSFMEWTKRSGGTAPQSATFSKRLLARFPQLKSDKSNGIRVIKGIRFKTSNKDEKF